MKEIIEKNKCCGCHACFNICPKDAISMQEDEKGFLYPVINEEKCINCNMCRKVCPVLNKKEEMKNKIKAYACYNRNLTERLKSSSGGIFCLIAKEIINRNGVVFGAAFDENFEVKHTYVENEKELKQFMGSKYTQSKIGNTYKDVKDFLDNGKYVLFTGTPCQIEGLKSYLRKDYEKLYTQDIICHGVPSPKVWKKYLEYQKNRNKEEIKDISFRNKDHGWISYRMKILFNTKTYSKDLGQDPYMQAFLKNICLRESCYNCSFKKKNRVSDITLADYWGIDKVHPKMNDNKGISLVLVNSNKGIELFNNIKEKISYKETDLDQAIKYNPALIESAKHCINEMEFINNIDNMEFDKVVKKYVPQSPAYKKAINIVKKVVKYVFKNQRSKPNVQK